MKIGHAGPEDLERLSRMEAESYPEAEGASKESIRKRLESYPDHFWILEDDAGEIVSFVNGFATDLPNLTDEMYDSPQMHDPDGDWQMIFSVVTAPEHRGRGYAGMLLTQVLEDAKRQNRRGVVLTCKERLVPFYSKFGFLDEGISTSVHGGAVWHQMRYLCGHIESIEKQTDNRFLNMYHLTFHDRAGRPRDYYFASRNEDAKLKVRTHELSPEGICIYAVTTEAEPRLALVHEYRFPIDEYIYSLPCGLIDPGESAGQAAARELKEETGYSFHEYEGGAAYMRRPFFLAPGFSDEPGSAIFGTIDGLDGTKENESTEWIEVLLADKREVLRILQEEKTSVRAAFLMQAFLKSSPDEPFAFLSAPEI